MDAFRKKNAGGCVPFGAAARVAIYECLNQVPILEISANSRVTGNVSLG